MNTIDASIHIEHLQNGTAITRILSSYLPDLVFLDLDMSAKNGLQCLKEIRSNLGDLHCQ
jgi:DNA-binding response OmpR family regulator